MKLSASLIVKNEESCLDSCLSSIKDVDEIVIIDTGSTDNTREIATKYTDKFIENEYKWNDNFAEARNYSLNKTTGDWILIIDADEYLEEGGIEKIKEAIKKTDKRALYFKTISAKKGEEHWSIRAFKKDKDIYWKGAIHNYLTITDAEKTDIKLYYGYSEAHKQDPDRALRILKKEAPNGIRERYYLAREYWYRKEYQTAIDWYIKYLEVAHWGPEIADAHLMMARCYMALGENGKAKTACLEAIGVNADFKEALILMSQLTGPNNSKKWKQYTELSNNENVLFKRV